MSFMVENIFPSSEKMRKDLTKMTSNIRNVSQKCGVKAGQDIPCGARSCTFTMQDLSTLAIGEGEVILNHRGLIEMRQYAEGTKEMVWGCSPNFSPDIHSCNIQIDISLCDGPNSTPEYFIMKATKNISKGCELFLWFSEEVLAMLNMPFLTPKNITGHKKYSCHICCKTFETPNPLKIHLLLSCERESMSHVWQKIAKILINQRLPILENQMDYKPLQSNIERPSSVCAAPNSPKLNMNARCISEPPLSAFLPYKKQTNFCDMKKYSNNDTIQPLNLTMSQMIVHDNLGLNISHNPLLELRLTKSLQELSSNYAADVELFASNWGKIKQGHLCVYCGKIYSRKYGLKIHIRTHTGYKPLKCKYCQRPFGDPSNLNKHVRLHASGVTPYMCSLCGKVLVRRRDLERHMKSQHSNEDPSSSDDNIDIDE